MLHDDGSCVNLNISEERHSFKCFNIFYDFIIVCISWNKKYFDSINAPCKHEDLGLFLISTFITRLRCVVGDMH
jgi:hypothetical protein